MSTPKTASKYGSAGEVGGGASTSAPLTGSAVPAAKLLGTRRSAPPTSSAMPWSEPS